MTETVEHDGVGWRLTVAPTSTGGELVLTIEQLHTDEWLPTQRWTESAPEPRHRKQAITESARAHGWITPTERWPRTRKDGIQVLEDMLVKPHVVV